MKTPAELIPGHATPRPRDAEIKALVAVNKALDKLDEAGRARVLAFVVAQQEST